LYDGVYSCLAPGRLSDSGNDCRLPALPTTVLLTLSNAIKRMPAKAGVFVLHPQAGMYDLWTGLNHRKLVL